MIGLDGMLLMASYATAIIASLQAGSRAKYLLEHNEIDIKDGPLILPSMDNNTSPLWTLVQAFQQSVELGLAYHLDEKVHEFTRRSVKCGKFDAGGSDHVGDPKIEPYSLSPFSRPSPENEELDQLVDMYIEEAINSEKTSGAVTQKLKILLAGPSAAVAKFSDSTKYWTKRAWYWSKSREEFDVEFLEETDDGEMDLMQCLSKKIRLYSIDGNETQQVAQITAYAPEAFARLRSHFGISESDFRGSIFGSGPYISYQTNSKGAARSGGVFFFTRDGAYMIKTIKPGEAETFIKMLQNYYKHMKRNKRQSLLTRFCGIYNVDIRDATSRAGLNDEQQYTFVIMNSVFPAKASNFISQMYDLKGSTVGRECSEEEKQRKGPNAVLKDLDLVREMELLSTLSSKGLRSVAKGSGIQLGASKKSKLLAQLRKDVALLRECRVMDYSLLVGVVNIDSAQIDPADQDALFLIANEGKLFERKQADDNPALRVLTTPVGILMAPPLIFTRRTWQFLQRAISSVLTWPLPYYGASSCGVNGGSLSVLHGHRSGKRAIYYLGLIDFLQPWTTRKVAEKELKRLLGYDVKAISCVDPEEYAERFLNFIEAHIS